MAAVFQLYTALRVKPKTDSRPKKTSVLRSYVAIAVLMIASAAGGYLFAEFRQQQAIEDARAMHEELRGMRDEINAQLQALKQTAEHLARERGAGDEPAADAETLVLARGPVDRACNETGSDAAACDALREPEAEPAAATPAGTPVRRRRRPVATPSRSPHRRVTACGPPRYASAPKSSPLRSARMPTNPVSAVDPDGLLEFSVVFTDRSLNHMSASFQAVMRDISATLEEGLRRTLGRRRAGRRHVRHGIRRATARHGQALPGAAQRLVQLPLDADLRNRRHPGRGNGAASTPHRHRHRFAVGARSHRRGGGAHCQGASRPRVRAARRDGIRHSAAGRLPEARRRRRARRRRTVRARLHRVRHAVGEHAGDRRRRADQRAAEGLVRHAGRRARDVERTRARARHHHEEHELRDGSRAVAQDHGDVRRRRPRVSRHDADRQPASPARPDDRDGEVRFRETARAADRAWAARACVAEGARLSERRGLRVRGTVRRRVVHARAPTSSRALQGRRASRGRRTAPVRRARGLPRVSHRALRARQAR